MLSGRGLWVRHGRRGDWVLRDVDVDVAPGEVVGLWGPSGVGKSTLATVLAGLLAPQRGEVTVDGGPVTPAAGPRPVQLVLQHAERAVNPRWRIRDVLAEAEPTVVAGHDEDELVPAGWLDRRPHELSGGELQRVNLCRALLARPSYVLADEISASLDPITQALLWRRLTTQVREDGLGVLAISHDRHLLDRVADRVVTLAGADAVADTEAEDEAAGPALDAVTT